MTIYKESSTHSGLCFRRRYHEEGCAYPGCKLLAYATLLLALAPLAIIFFTLPSFIPVFQGISRRMQELLFKNFIPSAVDGIFQYLEGVTRNVTSLSILNIFFLGIVTLLLMYNINRVFIAMWHTEQHLQFSIHFLIYFVFLLFSPFLLATVMILGIFLIGSYSVANLINLLPYMQKLLLCILPYDGNLRRLYCV